LALVGVILSAISPVWSAEGEDAGAMVTKAVAYLTSHQGEDGSFSPQTGPAVTAMVVAAVLNNGRTAEDPVVAKGLKYLEKFVQEDGGIYQKDTFHKN